MMISRCGWRWSGRAPLALCAMSDYQVARFAAVEARAEALLRPRNPSCCAPSTAAPSGPIWRPAARVTRIGRRMRSSTLVAETKRAEVCTGIPAGGGATRRGRVGARRWRTRSRRASGRPVGEPAAAQRPRARHPSHSFTHWFAIQDDVEVGAHGLKPFGAGPAGDHGRGERARELRLRQRRGATPARHSTGT